MISCERQTTGGLLPLGEDLLHNTVHRFSFGIFQLTGSERWCQAFLDVEIPSEAASWLAESLNTEE